MVLLVNLAIYIEDLIHTFTGTITTIRIGRAELRRGNPSRRGAHTHPISAE